MCLDLKLYVKMLKNAFHTFMEVQLFLSLAIHVLGLGP